MASSAAPSSSTRRSGRRGAPGRSRSSNGGGETRDACPLREEEWGSFDLVHARYLLEHVPDPLAVVRGMTRAARPGGRVVLEDDDHDVMRIWPEPAGFTRLWTSYYRTFER